MPDLAAASQLGDGGEAAELAESAETVEQVVQRRRAGAGDASGASADEADHDQGTADPSGRAYQPAADDTSADGTANGSEEGPDVLDPESVTVVEEHAPPSDADAAASGGGLAVSGPQRGLGTRGMPNPRRAGMRR